MEEKSIKKRNIKKKNRTHNLNKSYGVQLNLGAILQRKVEVYKMHQYPNQNPVLSFVSHSSSHNSFSSSSDNSNYYDEFLKNIINEKKHKSKSQKTDNLKKPLHNYQLNNRRPRGKSDSHNNLPMARISNKKNSAMKIYLTPINEEKKTQSNIIKKIQGNNNSRKDKKEKEKSEQCLTVNNETSFSIIKHRNEVNAMIVHKDKDKEKEKEKEIKDEKGNANINSNTNDNNNANGDTVANTQGNDNGIITNNISTHDNHNKATHSMIIQNKISHPNVQTHNTNTNTRLSSLIKIFHSEKKRDRRQSCYLNDVNYNSNLHLLSPDDDTTANYNKQNIISVSPSRIQMNGRIPRAKYNSNDGVFGKDIRNSNSNHKRNTHNNNINDLYKPNSNSNTNNNECLPRESINHSNNNSKHRKKELNKELAQFIKNSMNNNNCNKGSANNEQSKKKNVFVNEKESKNQITNIQVVTPIKEAIIKPKKKTNWFLCCIPIKGK